MPVINVSSAIGVVAGPVFNLGVQLKLDAYDVLNVTVPKASTNLITVELQPGTAGQVQLLYIASDAASSAVTYQIGATTTAAPTVTPLPITLDQPLLLIGAGAVGLYQVVPNVLWVRGGAATTADEHLTILVGRKVS